MIDFHTQTSARHGVIGISRDFDDPALGHMHIHSAVVRVIERARSIDREGRRLRKGFHEWNLGQSTLFEKTNGEWITAYPEVILTNETPLAHEPSLDFDEPRKELTVCPSVRWLLCAAHVIVRPIIALSCRTRRLLAGAIENVPFSGPLVASEFLQIAALERQYAHTSRNFLIFNTALGWLDQAKGMPGHRTRDDAMDLQRLFPAESLSAFYLDYAIARNASTQMSWHVPRGL